jgi:feruloyl esterase
MACRFQPRSLLCKGEDARDCLTAPQVRLAETIYGGAVNPRTGAQIYPGWERGSELGWGVTAGPEPEGPAISTFRYVVFQNPEWDWRTLNFDSDIALADRMGASQIDATQTDLSPFLAHGGKLLLFHGWSDPNVAPRNTVNYFNAVTKKTGTAKTSRGVRLFLAPGMGHCAGGEGPSTFDRVAAMDRWISTGQPPESMIASHSTDGKIDRTRPLCAFPKVAKYNGTGSIDDAANFRCVAPR